MNDAYEITAAETRYGTLLHFTHDDPIGRSLDVYGEWAQTEIELLLAFLTPGSTVVDIGANIGTHTIAFARQVGPDGIVHAFEPQRPVFELLQRNIADNGLTQVTAHFAGVGRSDGEMRVPTLDFSVPVNGGAVALAAIDGADDGEIIPVIPIDKLALAECRLVKIDAEGMEGAVLEGMAGTLQRLKPIVFAECNTVDTGAAILNAVDWRGYQIFLVRTPAFNPANHLENPDNLFGVACESSLLCLPAALAAELPSLPLVEIIPVANIHSLAEALLATPRYGDATDFDRDPPRLRQALATYQADAVRLGFRVATLERQMDRDARAIAERDATIAQQKATIAAMLASSSWRLTKPLRLVKTAIAKAVGKPSR